MILFANLLSNKIHFVESPACGGSMGSDPHASYLSNAIKLTASAEEALRSNAGAEQEAFAERTHSQN